MKRNIIFIGSMGSGKSHIGRNLALALGWQFVDTDRYLEKTHNSSIAEIYESLGEKAFRQTEMALLKRVCLFHEAVISFGGNFPMEVKTIKFLKKYSFVIVLKAEQHRIINRIKRRIGKRPTMNYEDIQGFVNEMVQEWKPAFRHSDFTLDTTFGDSEELVVRVQEEIHKKNIIFKQRRIAKEVDINEKHSSSDKRR